MRPVLAIALLKAIPTETLHGLRDLALMSVYFLAGCQVVICRAIWRGPAPLFGRCPAALFGISLRLIHP